jgi:hypothetical protein
LSLLFQRTTDFERFLDDTTCLIRGRKGTGKTALYWLFLQHKNAAQKLAHGRLDNTVFLSAHGRFQESRPSRDEFQISIKLCSKMVAHGKLSGELIYCLDVIRKFI